MKNYFYILLPFFLFSCEDVIDVDLNTAPPKLVIDASLNWFKNTPGNEQEIKLTLSAPYFEDAVAPATGAQVVVTKNGNETFVFSEIDESGIYTTNSFIPEINETYDLTITYLNEVYTATETLVSVVDLDFVEQNDGYTRQNILA